MKNQNIHNCAILFFLSIVLIPWQTANAQPEFGVKGGPLFTNWRHDHNGSAFKTETKTGISAGVFYRINNLLGTTFTELDAANLKLSLAIKRSKAESDLEEKDEVRDDKVRALYYLLNGFLYHPTKKIKEAAQQLMEVFSKYGLVITGESYATESSLVGSLLLDLAKPEYSDAIATLSGCADLIAALKAAQTDFEQARLAYETEKAKEGMVENATIVKKEVLTILNDKIVVYLRAMEQVNPATYGIFANTIAEIIASTNEQVKKRKQKPEEVKPE